MPILVGGGGERVTLRLVAEHADAWNSFGPPASFRHKNQVLDDWCADVGRDPADIERTVAISPRRNRRTRRLRRRRRRARDRDDGSAVRPGPGAVDSLSVIIACRYA